MNDIHTTEVVRAYFNHLQSKLFLSITVIWTKLISHKISNLQSPKQALDNKGKTKTKSCKIMC
jgi:hypothetical protein